MVMNLSFSHLTVQINLLFSHPRRFILRILSKSVADYLIWTSIDRSDEKEKNWILSTGKDEGGLCQLCKPLSFVTLTLFSSQWSYEINIDIIVSRGLLLTRKLLNQGFLLVKLKSLLLKLYGSHHHLVDRYGIYVSQVTMDMFHLS